VSLDDSTRGWLNELLVKERSGVLERWADGLIAGLQGRRSRAELQGDLVVLLDALDSFAGSESGDLAPARAALAELSADRARQGFSPSETASTVFAFKRAVMATAGDEADSLVHQLALSDFVDELGLFTFETFAKTRESVIADQAEQLLELSTPVVKLWEGIVAVPLVGTLDSARTQVVMENLLQTLVDTGSAQAIIDITGVPAVDTQVAQHLLKTVSAARLMGAEVTISGIRPQIAQTMVSLGIEFGDIATKSSLADALIVALSRSGFEVVRATTRRG
jgi:rsbT co-antagonist protein RsbR